jgi:CheY-like chemotaxis protein
VKNISSGEAIRAAARLRADHRMGSPPLPLTGIHVLVVDDNDDLREVVGAILGHFGAFVSPVATIADTRRLLERMTPDVVVCDVDGAGDEAYAFVQTMAAFEAGRAQTPVVGMTGSPYEHPVERMRAAGFAARLAKPVSPEVLRDVVMAVLEEKGGSAGRRRGGAT